MSTATDHREVVGQILRNAKRERCFMRETFEREAPRLSGRMQSRLARGLTEIKPVWVRRNGGPPRPSEAAFRLKPGERAAIAETMLREGSTRGEILAAVTGLGAQTLRRLHQEVTYPTDSGPQTALESQENGAFSETKGNVPPGDPEPDFEPGVRVRLERAEGTIERVREGGVGAERLVDVVWDTGARSAVPIAWLSSPIPILSFSSSGTSWLIHKRILELLNPPDVEPAFCYGKQPRPDWHSWVYGGARRPSKPSKNQRGLAHRAQRRAVEAGAEVLRRAG